MRTSTRIRSSRRSPRCSAIRSTCRARRVSSTSSSRSTMQRSERGRLPTSGYGCSASIIPTFSQPRRRCSPRISVGGLFARSKSCSEAPLTERPHGERGRSSIFSAKTSALRTAGRCGCRGSRASCRCRLSPAGWNWGVRVAQRVLQLEIDLLTSALASVTDPTTADSILDARIAIERALVFLDGVHAEFAAPRGRAATAVNLLDDDSPQARADELEVLDEHRVRNECADLGEHADGDHGVHGGVRLAQPGAAREHGLRLVAELREQASPPDWRSFLEPALAVEVIRRTFSDDFDIESAQPLNVAQLTPTLPAPLLTLDAEHPPPGKGIESAPLSSHDKLAGLRVNHFGGFYRSSWRENDFMWGRIDGCSALARLLVDPLRAQHLRTLYVGQDRDPAAQLARALVPTGDSQWGDTDRVRLLRELVPAQTPDSAEAPAAPPDPTDLERDLRQAIEEDLYGPRGIRPADGRLVRSSPAVRGGARGDPAVCWPSSTTIVFRGHVAPILAGRSASTRFARTTTEAGSSIATRSTRSSRLSTSSARPAAPRRCRHSSAATTPMRRRATSACARSRIPSLSPSLRSRASSRLPSGCSRYAYRSLPCAARAL